MRLSPFDLDRIPRAGAIAAIPLVLLLVQPNWIYTNPYTVPWFDEFVYLSLFTHGPEYLAHHPSYYPATRLPWILIGHGFYRAFPPLWANLLLKLSLFIATSLLTLAAARTLFGPRAAAAAILLLCTYPYFVATMGWEYVDPAVNLFMAAGYLLAARVSRTSVVPEATIGALGALLLSCHMFTATLFPPFALFYAAMVVRTGSGWRLPYVQKAIAALSGLLVTFLGLSFVNHALGGELLFVVRQVQAAADASSLGGFRIAARAPLLATARWIAVPTAAFVAAAVTTLVALVRIHGADPETRRREWCATLVMLHFAAAYGLFWIATFTSVAVLTLWFYVGFLHVSCYLTLAAVFDYWSRVPHDAGKRWPWIAAATLLVAIYWAPLGGRLQDLLGVDSVGAIGGTILVLAGITLVVMSFRRTSSLVLPCAALVVALAYLGMMAEPQLNHADRRDRRPGFLAVLDAAEAIRAASNDARRYVWTDFDEPPHGPGIFRAAWIASLLSARRGLYFGLDETRHIPLVWPDGLKPGDRIVIMTARPDWREAVSTSLDLGGQGLVLAEQGVTRIERGPIRFQIVGADVVRP